MSHQFGEPYELSAKQAAINKRKRYLSLSDEDIIEGLDIKGLSYRRGWPQLAPLPLEGTTRHLDKVIPVLDQRAIEDKARQVLTVQRLNTGEFGLMFRIPYDIDDNDLDALTPCVTFVFTADMVKDADRIDTVIVRLCQEFKKFDSFQNVRIECLHLGCIGGPPPDLCYHSQGHGDYGIG